MSRNKEHRGAAFFGGPNGAAAEGGRPIWSMFFVSANFINIPYIFLIYSTHTYIYICPKYFPSIFLRMFRNLFSQQY